MFTYDDTLSRPLDQVRFQLGDTQEAQALLSDEAITAAITRNGASVAATVADLARGLVAYLGLQPIRESADGVSVDYSGRLPVLQTIIMRADAATGTGTSGIQFVPRRDTAWAYDEYGRPWGNG